MRIVVGNFVYNALMLQRIHFEGSSLRLYCHSQREDNQHFQEVMFHFKECSPPQMDMLHFYHDTCACDLGLITHITQDEQDIWSITGEMGQFRFTSPEVPEIVFNPPHPALGVNASSHPSKDIEECIPRRTLCPLARVDVYEAYERIQSHEDLVEFILALRQDFNMHKHNHNEWKNNNLSDFLDAMGAWFKDYKAYAQHHNLYIPSHPSWKTLGDFFLAGKRYQ